MDVLGWVLVSLVVALIAFWAAVAIIVLRMARALRRSTTVRTIGWRVRMATTPGPRRTAIALRADLARTVERAHAALAYAIAVDRAEPGVRRLVLRIDAGAASVDGAIAFLLTDHDAGRVAVELPALRSQAAELSGIVDRLSSTIRSVTSETGGRISILRDDVDREAAALAAGTNAYRDLTRRDRP
ncbi:hypothetical protein EDF24_2595 [Curtobacterium sp. PhB130]|uniref:hypothetical protein n=1 Tax=Curtobacterium sp. PhB130 TaxID=2485178 RepID=UPI000FB3EE7D|nr:hypothetical protein [Curtobacterium sp. PhB130]ROS75154.1 hypothetical protein EDF24_2595 [Curtobacterium sp. PhB130]